MTPNLSPCCGAPLAGNEWNPLPFWCSKCGQKARDCLNPSCAAKDAEIEHWQRENACNAEKRLRCEREYLRSQSQLATLKAAVRKLKTAWDEWAEDDKSGPRLSDEILYALQECFDALVSEEPTP